MSLTERVPLTEKVDVYALGNLLFHILTTHSPRGKMKAYRMEAVRLEVLAGIPPPIPKEILSSKDPAVVAMKKGMEMCFAKDPKDRATAREVADLLMDAYLRIIESSHAQEQKRGGK